MMKIQPIERKTICQEIVDQFKQMLVKGQLKQGEKLLGERELSKLFNVSRSSVREALLILSSIGLIKRNSEGSYVNTEIPLNVFDPAYYMLLKEEDYKDLYEARKLIETATIEQAAIRADADDINYLEEILGEMQKSIGDTVKFSQLDAEFHLNIALSSKNKVLYQFVNTVNEFSKIQVEEKLKRYSSNTDDEKNLFKKTLNEHRDILNAIKNRDSKLARNHMYNHINQAEDLFKNSLKGLNTIG